MSKIYVRDAATGKIVRDYVSDTSQSGDSPRHRAPLYIYARYKYAVYPMQANLSINKIMF